MIFDGESERPLAISTDGREEGLPEAPDLGTSSMLSRRPVVGSLVEDVEGSCETWYPSMMN